MTAIRLATLKNLPELITLFDSYRVFYEQESNPSGAYEFLKERIQSEQSIIFLAFNNNTAIGFTQLYPSYSSVSLQGVLILNDLYVAKPYRKHGVGEALLNKAKAYCKENNLKGLALETATDNPAQRLYERLGWKKDLHCFHYFWSAV